MRFGDKTLTPQPEALAAMNVRRLLLLTRDALDAALRHDLFDESLPTVQEHFEGQVMALEYCKENGMIKDYEATLDGDRIDLKIVPIEPVTVRITTT